jgi:thymidine kinase
MNNLKMSMSDNAYLEIILGCMYAGKSSKIAEIYKQYQFCKIPTVVINHSIDNRYSENGEKLMVTHDGIKVPCIPINNLMDVVASEEIEKCHVILINEGQFFNDLIEFVKIMLENNKKIFVCGLDGDYERNKFGQMLDLIPLCDKVYKLTSLCSFCKDGSKGIFSLRRTFEKEQILVGGNDKYDPVCRKCYEKNMA